MTKRFFIFSLGVLVVLATIANAQTSTVVGSWDVTIESPQGTRNSLLVIKQDGDKLTGMMKSPRGERPLDSITVKGSDITMTMKVNAQGQELVIVYKGKIEKDKLSGDADFGGMASGTWSAVPHKEGAAEPASPPASAPASDATNISGVWNFTVELSAGTGTPVFTLKQEGERVTGTYKGQLGEAPVTGTVKGSDVTLMLKVSPQGEEITVTYSGKITGKDAMSGKATFGTLGEGTWTAKKKS